MKFNDTLHPFDPYTGEQMSFIRYSGYRTHQFHMPSLDRRVFVSRFKSVTKIVGGVALAAAGFGVFALLALGVM